MILAGDLLNPTAKAALNDFAGAYYRAVQLRGQEALDELWGLSVRLSVFVVAHNPKEDITWTEIPSTLTESWRRSVSFSLLLLSCRVERPLPTALQPSLLRLVFPEVVCTRNLGWGLLLPEQQRWFGLTGTYR